MFPIHSDGEEDEAQPFGEEPRQAEPASGSAQPGGEEAQRARPLRAPPVPTPQMVAEHEVTHIPYRSWCPACVAGRGRSYSHHHEGRDSTVPVISADYLYFSEKGVPGKSLPTVVLRDRASKAIFSHLLPTKGTVGSTYPEKAVLRDLNWLGYKRLVLKTDQENAIKALATAVNGRFSRGPHSGRVTQRGLSWAKQRHSRECGATCAGTSAHNEVCPGTKCWR